jgi:hypothetical protein
MNQYYYMLMIFSSSWASSRDLPVTNKQQGESMAQETENQLERTSQRRFTGMQVLGLIIASMCLAAAVTVIVMRVFLFPGPLKPVVLSEREEQQLAAKLEIFEAVGRRNQEVQSADKQIREPAAGGTLKPDKYSEEGLSRDISLTERELNGIVAKNTDMAEKLAIDLAEDMVSIKLLIPLDPDFPMLGGKTLNVRAGAELAYRQARPVVILKGVSIMGVPMPNAWLGGLKNIDLVKEFGADEGFWKTFAAGVDSISVAEGLLKIRLKE